MHIPTGYSQVNLKFTGVSVPTGAEVTFGLRHDAGTPFPGDIAVDVYGSLAAAGVNQIFTSDASITSVLVKNGPNADGPFAEISGTYPGIDGADSNPPAVAAMIRKNTAFGGRAGRGRMYWPSVLATRFDDSGIATPAYVGLVNVAIAAFITELTLRDLTMVLLHTGALPPPYVVTSVACDGRAATQRRRQRRN
jgi:hypothetical protein